MNITIIAVGRLKEKYLKLGVQEYSKRLSRYCKLNIIEVSDEKAPENLSEAEVKAIKDKEGEKMGFEECILPKRNRSKVGTSR
ncbi:hypothetical protein F8154_14185, partial [Alkaliphilus pronyensis]